MSASPIGGLVCHVWGGPLAACQYPACSLTLFLSFADFCTSRKPNACAVTPSVDFLRDVGFDEHCYNGSIDPGLSEIRATCMHHLYDRT